MGENVGFLWFFTFVNVRFKILNMCISVNYNYFYAYALFIKTQ
jgi:hypothetical protein